MTGFSFYLLKCDSTSHDTGDSDTMWLGFVSGEALFRNRQTVTVANSLMYQQTLHRNKLLEVKKNLNSVFSKKNKKNKFIWKK